MTYDVGQGESLIRQRNAAVEREEKLRGLLVEAIGDLQWVTGGWGIGNESHLAEARKTLASRLQYYRAGLDGAGRPRCRNSVM